MDSEQLRRLWDGWQPPPELERSRPRPVRFTWKGKTMVVAMVLAVVAAGIAVSRLLYGRTSHTPLWAAPLAFIAMAIAVLWTAVRLTRERRLLEEGHVAPAIVTRLGIRTDKGRMVYYEFATYSGSAIKGKYGPVHGKWVLPVGAPIVVLYDRDEPKRSTRYPSSLVALDY